MAVGVNRLTHRCSVDGLKLYGDQPWCKDHPRTSPYKTSAGQERALEYVMRTCQTPFEALRWANNLDSVYFPGVTRLQALRAAVWLKDWGMKTPEVLIREEAARTPNPLFG